MSDPTVILLPGLLCDKTVWSHQHEEISTIAECIVPIYQDQSSITAMALGVLSGAPRGPLLIAGHSMGGRVALELARLAPSRILSIALLDTGTEPIDEGIKGKEEVSRRMALLNLAKQEGMRAMGQKWAQGMVHPDRILSQVFEEILTMLERSTPEQFETQLRALIARPDARPTFAALTCPTVLICGRQDAWSPLARHEQMQRELGGSRLVTIENSGHMSTMEQPEAVSRALAQWAREGLREHPTIVTH